MNLRIRRNKVNKDKTCSNPQNKMKRKVKDSIVRFTHTYLHTWYFRVHIQTILRKQKCILYLEAENIHKEKQGRGAEELLSAQYGGLRCG